MKLPKDNPHNKLPILRPLIAIIALTGISIGLFHLMFQHWMDSLLDRVELQHRQNLTQIVSVARHAVEPILNEFRSGKLSDTEARMQMRALIRNMTYQDQYGNNYIFMSSYDGTMLVQPFEPEKELTNQWNLQDFNGLYLVQELVKAAKAHPSGSFVKYFYHLPGVHLMQEKLAYVIGLPELNCYIGTGMYMQRALREQMEILKKVSHSSIWMLLVVLVPVSASIMVILRKNRLLLSEILTREEMREDLKKSEAKYRSIFENAVEGMFQSSPEGRFIRVNPALAHMAGYDSPQEMIDSISSIEMNHYSDPRERGDYLKLLEQNGFVKNYVVKLKRKDGSTAWGSTSSRIVKDEMGNTLYYEGTLEDITERKQAEEEVKRLAAIIRRSSEIVNLSDPDGTMVFLNEAGSKMLGVDPEDFKRTNIMQVVPDHLKGMVEKELLPALARGDNWEGELQLVNLKTGKISDLHTLAFTIDDPDARYQKYYASISLDISQRKRSEEMSRQSEEKFSKVFMTTPDGIAITHMSDGSLIDINHGFEEITGWKRNEIIGRSSLDIGFWINPSDRDFMLEYLKAGRDILHREVLFGRKDGAQRNGIYSARSIQIAGESCIIYVLQDVTDRLALEEDRRKLEHRLYQSQKMDAIGQLAGGIAHDFNNILTGIQGNVSLMLMNYDSQHPHYERLGRIEQLIERGANLTKQLLGFAREGKYEVKVVSINDLIRRITLFFTETRREIEVNLHLQDTVYPVEVDAGQIEQVLVNLYINAGHAMPNGGHIDIQTTNTTLQEAEAKVLEICAGDYVKIYVTDTGIGMNTELLTRIFEPFFTTRSKEGGTGLGLASAYGIIRNHGGAIKAYSELGHGSTFTIYLPSSAGKTVANKDSQFPDISILSGSGVILVVDDEPMVLDLAFEMLKSLGYSVLKATDGQEAISIYRENQKDISLVILDMILPGMNGSQVLMNLKEINHDVKVILSSGYSLQGEVQKVMEMGCLGFIQKPYNLKDFSKIVHQVIHHTSPLKS